MLTEDTRTPPNSIHMGSFEQQETFLQVIENSAFLKIDS